MELLKVRHGKIPWNYINYSTAKTVAENYSNNTYVKSGLLTGTQWDYIMKWYKDNSYNVETDSSQYGNYRNVGGYDVNGWSSNDVGSSMSFRNAAFTKGASVSVLLQTGKFGDANVTGHPKNIYDLAGNLFEWTAEKYDVQRVLRGGSYDIGGTRAQLAYRESSSVTNATNNYGFRIVLYVD